MTNLITSEPEVWARENILRKLRAEAQGISGTIHTVTAERVKAITEMLSRGALPTFYPAQMQVHLTSKCPEKVSPLGDCSNCSFPNASDKHVNIDRLLSALAAFADHGGRSVFLSGGGEPGYYPYLKELLTFLAEDPRGQTLELTLNTNGRFLRKLADYTEAPGPEGELWRSRLRSIYSGTRGGKKVLSITSVSWHEDSQATEAVRMLSAMRSALRLYTVIRVSSLVYHDLACVAPQAGKSAGKVGGTPFTMTTSVAQVQAIERLATQAGADIISFKPAHINNGRFRTCVVNDSVYKYLKDKLEAQQSVAEANSELWVSCNADEDSALILENSPRLNRLKSSYQHAVDILINQKLVCLAPLVVLFLAPDGVAACCDTWGDGLGTPPVILTQTMLPPPVYYLHMLYWTLTSAKHYWPGHCVAGCGWTELNMRNPMNAWTKELIKPADHGSLNDREMWRELLRVFRGSLTSDMGSQDSPAVSVYMRPNTHENKCQSTKSTMLQTIDRK